jgi:hypothetical protein
MAPHLKFIVMNFDATQIEELKQIAPSLSHAQEGGYNFILIEKFKLPEGCQPAAADLLLCPTPRDGYLSRLFFSSKIMGCPSRNWNGNIRVLGKNWFAISWKVPAGLRLAEILLVHLKALRK